MEARAAALATGEELAALKVSFKLAMDCLAHISKPAATTTDTLRPSHLTANTALFHFRAKLAHNPPP